MKLTLMFFLLSILIISITTTNKKYNATAAGDLITATCVKTINPEICEHVMRSNAEAAGTSLRSLGEFSVEYAIVHAQRQADVFGELISQHRRDIDIHTACRDIYGSARNFLVQARNHFLENQYEQAKVLAAHACRMPGECQGFYGDNQSSEAKRMKKSNEQAKAVFNIPFTIARDLHQPGGGH